MKKGLYLAAAIAGFGILARLPHPARDISKLEPVRLVYIYEEAGKVCMETDTGDHGSGETLTEAEADMRARADGEIFLETAEFLLLDPDVSIRADLFALLRPACKVFYTRERPDLAASARFLAAHPPENTLRELRRNCGIP